MAEYKIQQYIKTLSENAVFSTESISDPGFEANGVEFYPWEYNIHDGWPVHAWLAESIIEADSANDAVKIFNERLKKLAPRICFVSQAYFEYVTQPFVVRRIDSEVAYFSFTKETAPAPLMFLRENKASLDLILADNTIPDTFYRYWRDATNCPSYTGKLLLMFGAIDTFKKPDGTIDYSMRQNIFGKDLKRELYEKNNSGLRHRLVHGFYLSANDGNNYVEIMHKKIIEYFNQSITVSQPLETEIVSPQRNFVGNYERMCIWLKQSKSEFPLDIKPLIESASRNGDPTKVVEDYELDCIDRSGY